MAYSHHPSGHLTPADVRFYANRVEYSSIHTVSLTHNLFSDHLEGNGLGQLLFVTRFMHGPRISEHDVVTRSLKKNQFTVGVNAADLASRALRIRLFEEHTIVRVEAHPEQGASQWHAHFENGRLTEFRSANSWVHERIPRQQAAYLLGTLQEVEKALEATSPSTPAA